MNTQTRDINEMKRLLSYANYSKVARALGVKRQVVSEWANGRDVNPKRLEEVRALMQKVAGKTKRSAPAEAGAAQELLGLWTGADPPPWAEGLTRQIINAIDVDREAALQAAGDRFLEIAERLLFPERDDEDKPGTGGPTPGSGGPRPGLGSQGALLDE